MENQITESVVEKDMLELSVDILNRAGLTINVTNHYLTNDWIKKARGASFESQRLLLNRFWNMQLIDFKNTDTLRFLLITDGDISDWLRTFHTRIVPFCIEHDLPGPI